MVVGINGTRAGVCSTSARVCAVFGIRTSYKAQHDFPTAEHQTAAANLQRPSHNPRSWYVASQTAIAIHRANSPGTNLSSTIVTLPALLQSSPDTLATQWKTLFDHGIAPVVTLSMSSAAGFAALAYGAGAAASRERDLYVAAAVAAFGLAPYTQILMGGVNGELSRRAGAGEKRADTHELVRTWGRYNLARGCLLLLSAGLGTWACVS